jgi:D-alanine transaminase
LVFLNGAFLELAEARISPEDRGFQFGDGLYEGVLACDGCLVGWEAHRERLERGLAELDIHVVSTGDLEHIARRLLAVHGLDKGSAAIHLQVTRGVAPRTQAFPVPPVQPTVYMSVRPHTRALEDGNLPAATAICVVDTRWERADLKTLNRLPNTLAAQAALTAGADVGIFVRNGVALEGTHTNLFAVVSDRLITHPLGSRILPGVTRARILGLARDIDLSVEERPVLLDELYGVDEVFLTGSLTEILPVVSVDGRSIGRGVPGDVTRQVVDIYLRSVRDVAAACQSTSSAADRDPRRGS